MLKDSDYNSDPNTLRPKDWHQQQEIQERRFGAVIVVLCALAFLLWVMMPYENPSYYSTDVPFTLIGSVTAREPENT